MARMVSFVVLLGILVVIGVIFFRVMANFLIPLFLAALLVIMFGPLHRWMTAKCKGRVRLAAAATTAGILLIVLLPLTFIFMQAADEGRQIYGWLVEGHVNVDGLARSLVGLGERVGVELDPAEIKEGIVGKAQEWLAPIAVEAVRLLGFTLLALAVMVIALYYFLADGPDMVRTVMRLSPLDDRYEEQLIERFTELSRAMVVATLAAAVTQGLLAGIGFYFAGVGAVFLLMVLTMLLAMVPFVGAAAVWIPVCLWLGFHDERTVAAIVLAIYGATIISMADNIIKPLILHGRAKLHPLLALLSVLGGVQALGPIGIFIGPMAVALLQTVLNMVRTELDAMDRNATQQKADAKAT